MNEAVDRFANRFTLIQPPLRGGTATVFKALDHQNGELVALKVFSAEGKDPAIINEIWHRESTALAKLNHENIVRFIDAGRCGHTGDRWICLEWLAGETLEDFLEKNPPLNWEDFNRRIGGKLLGALSYVAEENVVHRDLSTKNVIHLPSGQIKVIDFGQAKVSDIGIGLTVRDFRTVPFCPPEDDSGRHTQTRDPYSVAAIAVRAMGGKKIGGYDELYEQLETIKVPDYVNGALRKALDRVPSQRFQSIHEFIQALEKKSTEIPGASAPLPVRLGPAAAEVVFASRLELGVTPERAIVESLNESAAVSAFGDKLRIDTRRYRLTATVNSPNPDHLVITSVKSRPTQLLENVYQAGRWIPAYTFTSSLPQSTTDKQKAIDAVEDFLTDFNQFMAEQSESIRTPLQQSVSKWESTLEMARFVAKTRTKPLIYSSPRKEGNRLIVDISNPEDATEQELRTISVAGSWVFRGEVDLVKNGECHLLSTRPHFNVDQIPHAGNLEIDWQQTRTALDRQAGAVERFKARSTPSIALSGQVTGEHNGPLEEAFGLVAKFFDQKLDDQKRVAVSKLASGLQLLVVHGPPGTGKTKLIVEIVRQALQTNPSAKILLSSQTHVALDNALSQLLLADEDVSTVRIGSGTKEADARVARSSLQQRSDELRAKVVASAREFLEKKAYVLGVDKREVELGLAAANLLSQLSELEVVQQKRIEVEREKAALDTARINDKLQSTAQKDASMLRSEVLGDEIERAVSETAAIHAEIEVSRKQLRALGKDGASLAQQDANELQEWIGVLTEGEDRREIAGLLDLSDKWRQRFSHSEDFKAAIISSSSVVAGTCVGFCREEAAMRSTFDLCIIDEAGKATSTELLVPLAQARTAVLVGDHHQLPAVVDYAMQDPELMRRYGLVKEDVGRQLFFELSERLSEASQVRLETQYRMRGAIGDLVSHCFYDDTLINDPSVNARAVPDLSEAGLSSSVTWIDPYLGRSARATEHSAGSSFENAREANVILALLRKINVAVGKAGAIVYPSIAVISGYAAQVNRLRADVRRDPLLDRLNIECATVHSFQGREVDICIYSVTRRNKEGRVGMLSEWRHLNVALSRARNFLVIVGSRDFCRQAPQESRLARVVQFIEASVDCAVKEWGDD